MFKLQSLKVFVQQRLTAAVDEIFGHFEKTITEYEEEMSRQVSLRDPVPKSEPGSKGTDIPPEEQTWRSRQDQQHQALEPPPIKEEREELWTSQLSEQLQPLGGTDIIKFTFVPVQAEEEERPPSRSPAAGQPPACSSAEQIKAEGDDGGGSEPAGSFDPDGYLQPASEDEAWSESRDPLSGLKALNNKIVDTFLLGEERCDDSAKTFTCCHCRKSFDHRETLNRHMICHTCEKPYCCSVCERRFRWRGDFMAHARSHTGEKPFMCSACGKRFIKHGTLARHMRIHTGERPHVCSYCFRGFHRKEDLDKHVRTHTGEKPFSCDVCNRRFSRLFRMKNHKCVVESSSKRVSQS
ncbi:uncharacterized protein ACBR49_017336 [Aulostomus maculatus]